MTAAAGAARFDTRPFRWLAAAALAVVAVIAADYLRDRPSPPIEAVAPLDPADLRPGFGARSFGEALAQADREVAGARLGLAAHPAEWLRLEDTARALQARARLTASAADLAEADRLLGRALALAPWPAGPVLSRAAVSLTLHDLAGAERALERFDASASPPPAAEQAEARSMRCEIAFQRGRLAEARHLCGTGEDLSLALRRAHIAAKSGAPEAAARLVEDLLRRPGHSPQTLATLALQRASIALAQGDWPAAGRWVCAADASFPGYWLTEAYLAQQHALEGRPGEARRRYAALAERTRDPDVLDALAELSGPLGPGGDARQRAGQAEAEWRRRADLLPLTYSAHFGEHLLRFGDPRAALALSAGDYRRRPHGGTAEHYAVALLHNRVPAEALAVVRQAESQGWRTAGLAFLEARALASLGRSREADQALAEARARNPMIADPRQRFVVFGAD